MDTGNIGRRSLHAILGRPDLELVGVYAHGDKVGVDAAELSGWPELTGVHATNDIGALLASGADACYYNPLWPEPVLQCGLDYRWQAYAHRPRPDPGRLPEGPIQQLRRRCAHPEMTNLVGIVLSGARERVDAIPVTVTNGVRAVVAAEPGIVTLAALPPITGRAAI